MVNDTIDILNARIVNFGLEYIIVTDYETNRFTALNKANAALRAHYIRAADIGEPIYISDAYRVLQDVPGIIDVMTVNVVNKSGGIYSDYAYDFDGAMSSDGRRIDGEKDVIFELKYPDTDIKGSVR